MFRARNIFHFPLIVGLGLALTPAVFGIGPWVESRVFPVVSRAEVSNVKETRTGRSFYVSFEKLRQCEFLGLVWYEGPVRLVVDFAPDAEDSPRTRPTGTQFAGPWHVNGLHRLEGSRAIVFHRCHPLWVTITTFYEG